MNNTLVIVPCGKSKIWDKYPDSGSQPAEKAYTGSPFKVNREYARQFGDKWIILSAKYGYIEPETIIENYDITFKNLKSAPISVNELSNQVQKKGYYDYKLIIGLGGKDYRDRISDSFTGYSGELIFPFAGLKIGEMMSQTKKCCNKDEPVL